MIMEESSGTVRQRIFLGNLPKDVKVTHLFSVLPPGYDQSQIEIKHNYDIDKNITSSYAFANLEGTSREIKEWCDKASRKSLGGNVILVQFAKVSFLERLKEEVKSQRVDKGNLVSNLASTNYISPPALNVTSNTHNLSRFNENDSSCSESSGEAEKETHSSDDNDYVDGCHKIKKDTKAEVRRMESLKEKSSTHLNQQKIIRLAVKKMSKVPSNKIVFHDSDNENSNNAQEIPTNEENNKCKLFDDSDSGNEENETFFSESKSKLIRTKISATDERFRMDSKFFDEDNKISETTKDSSKEEQGKLLQMVDAIIEKDPHTKLKFKNKKELNTTIPMRFDPMQKNHSSFIIKPDEDIELEIKKPAKPKPFKVTHDRFYEFSEDLKEQFKKAENTSFSLLNMFGGSSDAPSDSKVTIDNKIQVSIDFESKGKEIKKLKKPLIAGASNFFNIDDNPESEDDEPVNDKPTKIMKRSWHERLFLNLEDPRIEEALQFFNSPPEDPIPYNVIRSHVKKIVKKKHRSNTTKSKDFKTKLGNRRKFQRGKGKQKADLKINKK